MVGSEDEDGVPHDGERDEDRFPGRAAESLGVGDATRRTQCPRARVSLMVEMIGAEGDGGAVGVPDRGGR
jgi:hypothetical protein